MNGYSPTWPSTEQDEDQRQRRVSCELFPDLYTLTGVDAAGHRIHFPGVAMAVLCSCHKPCHKHYWKTSHASSRSFWITLSQSAPPGYEA